MEWSRHGHENHYELEIFLVLNLKWKQKIKAEPTDDSKSITNSELWEQQKNFDTKQKWQLSTWWNKKNIH